MRKAFFRNRLKAAKFSASSLVSSAVDLSLFTLLDWLLGETNRQSIFIATVVARVISGVVNYCLNRNWVFRAQGNAFRAALLYLLLFLSLMLGSWRLVALLHDLLPLHPTLLKALVDGLLFIASYFIQKKVIFPAAQAEHKKG